MLHAGQASGALLVLDEPLSFWGGLDPASGRIVDTNHPQHGEVIGRRVLAMSGSRGSSGTPGVLGEALRVGVGPLAIVVTKPDANLVAGALVADALYDVGCPIVLVDESTFAALRTGDEVTVGQESSGTG